MLRRVLVIGCGGIGGVVAAHLAREGHAVTVVSRNAAIRAAVARSGLRVRGASSLTSRVDVAATPEGASACDLVLLATQPTDVEEAARSSVARLSPRGRMVCLQNGLCEERVARLVGEDRVVGAVVLWGAGASEPGQVERTSRGGFVLGTLGGSIDSELLNVARMLECIGRVTTTRNLRGVRWSKLAVNCAVSTLGTIGGERVGVLMRRGEARQLGLEVVSEAVTVARANGVRLEKLAGTIDLGWLTVSDRELGSAGCSLRLAVKHSMVFAAVAPYRRLRSSMLAAIERGRTPAVDFLNGEVVERADRLGIPVPVNRAARELVWAIARREERPGIDALHRLFTGTRSRTA